MSKYNKQPWWKLILISIVLLGGMFLIPMSIDEKDTDINRTNTTNDYIKRVLIQYYGELSSVKIVNHETLWHGETDNGNPAYFVKANYKIRLANSKALAITKCSYALFYVKDTKVISFSSKKMPLPTCTKITADEDGLVKKFINDGVVER